MIGAFTVRWSTANAFTEEDVITLELIAGALSAALSDAVGMDVLQTSEERLDEAQRTAHIGSGELDLATQKVTMSKEFACMLGMPPEQRRLDFATFHALFAPEDVARLDKHIQSAVRDGSGYETDIRRTFSEGETPRWHHAIGKPLRDAQGKVIRLAGTLMDITERKGIADVLESQRVAMREMNGRLIESMIRLEELATTDGLTGLKNHQIFYERLKEECDRAVRYHSPLAVDEALPEDIPNALRNWEALAPEEHCGSYHNGPGHAERHRGNLRINVELSRDALCTIQETLKCTSGCLYETSHVFRTVQSRQAVFRPG